MKRTERRLLVQDDEQPIGIELQKLGEARPADYLLRFVFGAGIAVVAGLISIAFGPLFGGLLLAFPAVLPASLTLIAKKEGQEQAVADASGGMLGAAGLAAFALTAHVLLTALTPAVALTMALAVWALVSGGLYALVRLTGLFKIQDRLVADSAPGD